MMGVSNTQSTAGLLKPRRSAIKIEKPRSLKLSANGDHNLENVLVEMDSVTQCLQGGIMDHRVIYPAITSLCDNLKMYGSQLETLYKDQLDKCYIYLRTGCRDDRLSLAARYRLLEIIELRAMNWKANQTLISYYHSKLQNIEAEEAAAVAEQTELANAAYTVMSPAPIPHVYPIQYGGAGAYTPTTPTTALLPPQTLVYAGQQYNVMSPAAVETQYHPQALAAAQIVTAAAAAPPAPQVAPILSPGEVVRTSGKFTKPTRIAGKNYCKDEVVIRNQDSGKVMGIKGRRVHMIEELSETIISFQRVAPGARERLVQITGPTEDNITHAKQLIEDTIRRNASPAREAHSLSSGGGSSVFSSSPLNGSNSSIASHTDDDNNSLTGHKRSSASLSQSLSLTEASDLSSPDYRYTVSHNNSNIRITGSSPAMVRTAKLVLDEYFNGQKNLNNISQLLSADSSPSPPSPPLLVKPATPPATPPPSSSSSPPPQQRGDESPKAGAVNILRQPLFPSSSKDAIDSAENSSSPGNAGAKTRRAAFAKTSEERRAYSRSELVALSDSELSRLTPVEWGKVVANVPDVVKKGSQHLPALLQTMSESGEESVCAKPSYLQAEDFIGKDSEVLNTSGINNYSSVSRSSSGTEE